METSGDDTGEDGRWLNYGELAEIRGIGRESAVKLAQRERWRRRPGNDGSARIFVPLDWLKPARQARQDGSSGHSPEIPGEFSRAIKAFEAGLSIIRERAEAESMALRMQAETAEGENRRLLTTIESLERERDQVRAEVLAERQARERAETTLQANRAGGRFGRVLRAWRGR